VLKVVAVLMFVGGLVLGVRVMFFGVQRRKGTQYLSSRVWPLALAIFLVISGGALYARAGSATSPGMVWAIGTVCLAAAVAVVLWRLVRLSAIAPSTDPEDDPRFKFQGHIARVVQEIGSGSAVRDGRVAFEFDGQREELRARWTEEAEARGTFAGLNDDVVIERVEEGVAFVEPWSVVEQRL
jgi:membrane protein implicated in regulation of membrane protease activity